MATQVSARLQTGERPVIATPPGTEIPVALRNTTLRRKGPDAVGVMTAGQLTQRFEIPRRDFRKKTGYQRDVSASRVNRLVNDLRKKRVDLPTAVLLNIRDFDPKVHLKGKENYQLFCPNGQALYVVDGQHRIEALSRLVNEEPERWTGFQVAFTCMLGASELEEMEEFYVVNSTAKSVRTDLALDLLKQRAENDPRILEALLERGESWKVEAQALTEEIAKTSVWQGRIRFPGEPKGVTSIGSSGMASSLQELLSNHFFGCIHRNQRVQILDAYWKGIMKVLPDLASDPQAFSLQKATGVQVMHKILISVLEYLRSTGNSLVDPMSYEAATHDALLGLEGDTTEGGVASGVDFWRSGPEGAAGTFSSNAGRRVLSARIRGMLPKPKVE